MCIGTDVKVSGYIDTEIAGYQTSTFGRFAFGFPLAQPLPLNVVRGMPLTGSPRNYIIFVEDGNSDRIIVFNSRRWRQRYGWSAPAFRRY